MRLLRNALRGMKKPADYILYSLDGTYEELAGEKKPLLKRLLTASIPNLQQVRKELKIISNDQRVKGVVLQLGTLPLSMPKLESLRQDIIKIKKKKEVIVWATNYNLQSYYLAVAAHKIYLQPGGGISPLGIAREYLFFADVLQHYGLKFEGWQISPYKSAADIFTRTEMSPEVKEMANWLADASFHTIIHAISQGRSIGEEKAKELIDNSPYIDSEAKENNLIDEIINIEDIEEDLQGSIKAYSEVKRKLFLSPKDSGKKQVAIIRVEGSIIDGKSEKPWFKPPFKIPFLSGPKEGDITVVQKIRRAQRSRKIGAVVFYIDSPGGSATASEAMYSALKHLAETKPVVVQMGSVAASGGYYIACPAHYIFAQPNTLTGSIGVLAGKLIDQGFTEKYHINRDTVYRGKNALYHSFYHPYTEEQREKGYKSINRIYDLFVSRAAEGRNLTSDQVKEVGDGKVWTGTQALKHRLIDELGGLPQAIDKASELAGLKVPSHVREITASGGMLAPPTNSDVSSLLLNGIREINKAHVLCICPWFFSDK